MNFRMIGIGVFAVFTLGILVMAGLYPMAFAGWVDLEKMIPTDGPFRELQAHFGSRVVARDWGFLAHVCGGMLALAAGPFQFWTSLRNSRPVLHRGLGYAYFIGVLVGGLGGLWSAGDAWGGTPTHMGFALLAVGWLASSGRGLSLILKGKIAEHQVWMRLSYGLTLAGFSLRVQMPLLFLIGMPELLVYQTVAWSCWIPQGIWWIARGRQRAQAHPGPRGAFQAG